MKTASALNTYLKETGGWVAAQLEACTRCGICAEACHFYQALGNPEYAPVWKLEPLRRAYEQRFTLAGKIKLALGMEKRLTDSDLEHWSQIVYEACTVCDKCAFVCPMGIEIGPLIHKVRTGLAAAGLVPGDLAEATDKQKTIGSPLGVTDEMWRERIDWITDEWESNIPVDKAGAETLVVFTSIELMKFPDNLAFVAKILNQAGENWTVSSKGREVVNFGFFEADEELTKLFMHRVFQAAEELGVKRLVISECGHAYEAFRWTAPNVMKVPEGLEIIHITGLIHQYWKTGRIKIKEGAFDGETITFHDSCKIQRLGGLIKQPREILQVLAPTSFKEMTPNKEQSMCCGGGGGVISIKEADSNRYKVFEMKLEQLQDIQAQAVCMVCSNCRLQFVDSLAHFNSAVKVHSLAELVARALI
ncbi:MAG TPA: (Fe-S)-binding protein [Candidatus Saccharicenans sp.]|nr:(Fe-S)-binding protein [Candidatus Saccharicenans sp.]HQO75927.1 (Fe-S)-binding protein [Candidatus Saccharicenans sp.]HUM79621.1 (Fe-S)-binding protein [Candidatus Saccharicenans sp.]